MRTCVYQRALPLASRLLRRREGGGRARREGRTGAPARPPAKEGAEASSGPPSAPASQAVSKNSSRAAGERCRTRGLEQAVPPPPPLSDGKRTSSWLDTQHCALPLPSLPSHMQTVPTTALVRSGSLADHTWWCTWDGALARRRAADAVSGLMCALYLLPLTMQWPTTMTPTHATRACPQSGAPPVPSAGKRSWPRLYPRRCGNMPARCQWEQA